MDFIWLISAVLVPFASGVAGGSCCFLFLNWGIYRFQLGLHHRLTECEGRVERETKIRASEASRKGRNVEKDLLEQIENQPAAQPAGLTLESWRKSKYGAIQKGP